MQHPGHLTSSQVHLEFCSDFKKKSDIMVIDINILNVEIYSHYNLVTLLYTLKYFENSV